MQYGSNFCMYLVGQKDLSGKFIHSYKRFSESGDYFATIFITVDNKNANNSLKINSLAELERVFWDSIDMGYSGLSFFCNYTEDSMVQFEDYDALRDPDNYTNVDNVESLAVPWNCFKLMHNNKPIKRIIFQFDLIGIDGEGIQVYLYDVTKSNHEQALKKYGYPISNLSNSPKYINVILHYLASRNLESRKYTGFQKIYQLYAFYQRGINGIIFDEGNLIPFNPVE